MSNTNNGGREPLLLLVEDDFFLLDGMVDILKISGEYEIIVARNGKEALELLQSYKPDAIVSDMMMPQMSGYELLETIRSRDSWSSIPFIVLSARNQPEEIQHSMDLGATGYLVKPFDPRELIGMIGQVLQS